MVPNQSTPGKRRRGRPSKALLSIVSEPNPPPVSSRRRALLTVYRRCITAHARLLAQAEELTRVEAVLQRFLVHDVASVFSRHDAALVQGLLGDITSAGATDITTLIDELTHLVSWLREEYLPANSPPPPPPSA